MKVAKKIAEQKFVIETGALNTPDAQPFEEVCSSTNVKNGSVEGFFPQLLAGFAFAPVAKFAYCGLPSLNSCIKNNGGVGPCTL